jgi:threonine aldolase
MRRAIAAAEVGDDALGDDPTTKRLEARVAELLGKDAALFFPSGIMANQTALAVLGQWGGEVVLDAGAHILHYEEGAAAALSGLQLRAVPSEDGLLAPGDLEAAIRKGSKYYPHTWIPAGASFRSSGRGRSRRSPPVTTFPSTWTVPASGTRASRAGTPPRSTAVTPTP